MKRVLIISYVFPPVGGAGVQRAVKFTKYLPRHGWEASVLTAANPSVPLFDSSLEADVPAGTVVVRARTYEPSYAAKASVASNGAAASRWSLKAMMKSAARSAAMTCLQPDPQILWAPDALRQGAKLLQQTPHDAILVTAPPFSSLIIGKKLSQKFSIPLVVDYRDEWELSNAHWENRRTGSVIARWQRRQQAGVLRQTKAIVATTRASADSIARTAADCGSRASSTAIYNGYDPDDFSHVGAEDEKTSLRSGGFRLTYTGTLWQLTNVEPLVRALEWLHSKNALKPGEAMLTICGRRTPDQSELLGRLSQTECKLDLRDYAPHSEIPKLLRASDCLCVLLADTADAARVMPAKLFEYMAARKPILAIAPPGEVWEVLQGYPAASIHAPGDVEGIAASIQRYLSNRGQNGDDQITSDAAMKFSRDAQAAQLSEVLNQVVGDQSSKSGGATPE
jgi:glycosyltransferase involved in cell wall biosynthesis